MIAHELFPELAATGTVPGPLGAGEEYYDWNDQSRKAVEELRNRVLRQAVGITGERRSVQPPARPT